MSIKIALIIDAPNEIILDAGKEELIPSPSKPVRSPDDPPFLNIGLAETGEFHISGPAIEDLGDIAASVAISYYFPDEESEDKCRPIDLGLVKVLTATTPRKKAPEGWRWRYQRESSRFFSETKFFEGGFLPPFKASDLTLYVVNLRDYGYDGHILARMSYNHHDPSYTEGNWREPSLEAEGYLED